MNIPTEDSEADSGMVNLTPLIDIVFLLLIFFMVTASFQEDERDLDVSIPEAENGEALGSLPSTLTVNIGAKGGFKVEGRAVERDELKSLLTAAKRRNGEKQSVIVRAHREAPTQFPVVVFDFCAGLKIKTSIAVAEAK